MQALGTLDRSLPPPGRGVAAQNLHVPAGVHAKELRVRTEEGPARVPGTESSGARMEVRRRLLQGLFAVPAVVPLTSGANTAAGSSVNCFFRSPQSEGNASLLNVVPSNPETGGAAWAVSVFTNTTTTASVEVFKGDDVVTWATLNSIQNTVFQNGKLYGLLDGVEVTAGTLAPTEKRASLNLVYQGGSTPFRVSSVGTTMMTSETGQHVMWGSCWSSFK